MHLYLPLITNVFKKQQDHNINWHTTIAPSQFDAQGTGLIPWGGNGNHNCYILQQGHHDHINLSITDVD